MSTRVYIDTSVISGYYADDEPRIQDSTRNFFRQMYKGKLEVYISGFVTSEIDNTKDEKKRGQLQQFLKKHDFKILTTKDEMKNLAEDYVKAGVIPRKYIVDALHIAVATLSGITVLASWNFEHIVRHKTRVGVNQINRKRGYKEIDLCSPEEV